MYPRLTANPRPLQQLLVSTSSQASNNVTSGIHETAAMYNNADSPNMYSQLNNTGSTPSQNQLVLRFSSVYEMSQRQIASTLSYNKIQVKFSLDYIALNYFQYCFTPLRNTPKQKTGFGNNGLTSYYCRRNLLKPLFCPTMIFIFTRKVSNKRTGI